MTDIPYISVNYPATGATHRVNELGMRPMQERAFEKRGEQYLLIKSPPASGKSRALMFIALDKLHNQGVKQAIIAVPERSIGASFRSTPLTKWGFWADWEVKPEWNLCEARGTEGSKVKALGQFLESGDTALVCTHATLRFAIDEFGIEAFDGRLLGIDEFHHVSADVDANVLGRQLHEIIERDRTHIVAMTGSYFRGDAVPILRPEDELRFETVTFTYYEQLAGYKWLKRLDIGYYFYDGAWLDSLSEVLDPDEKTIIHIPSVNARESTKNKYAEVDGIIGILGEWTGTDEQTGFHLIKRPDGRVLKVADLVEDDPATRAKVVAALRDPAQEDNRDHVDIIIALGMAKEGFDWIWCEHALTIGYRSSLTEVVQIIGRTTRDAPGKERARFTNMIAEPDASQEAVTEAVNDTLKAIAASLLMEQVLVPRFNFVPKRKDAGPQPGFDYGPEGYREDACNAGFSEERGEFLIEIKGLKEPKSEEAQRICREDLNEVVAAFLQDRRALELGLFGEETGAMIPQDLTQVRMGKIIRDKYPELDEEDREAIRQRAVAALNLVQKAKEALLSGGGEETKANTAFVDGVRQFVTDVRELDIDLIDSINPFGEAYAILSKAMTEERLKAIANIIAAKKTRIPPDEALDLAKRAVQFKKQYGRTPSLNATDPWERRLAEGAAAFVRYKDEGRYDE